MTAGKLKYPRFQEVEDKLPDFPFEKIDFLTFVMKVLQKAILFKSFSLVLVIPA